MLRVITHNDRQFTADMLIRSRFSSKQTTTSNIYRKDYRHGVCCWFIRRLTSIDCRKHGTRWYVRTYKLLFMPYSADTHIEVLCHSKDYLTQSEAESELKTQLTDY